MSRGVEVLEAQNTVLDGANLAGAILDGADFRGVDLSQVSGLTHEQLQRAIVDEHTVLPPRLDL